MMFGRDADGTLLLLGYAQSGQDQATVHAFPTSRKSRKQLPVDAHPEVSATPIIRLAASLD